LHYKNITSAGLHSVIYNLGCKWTTTGSRAEPLLGVVMMLKAFLHNFFQQGPKSWKCKWIYTVCTVCVRKWLCNKTLIFVNGIFLVHTYLDPQLQHSLGILL